MNKYHPPLWWIRLRAVLGLLLLAFVLVFSSIIFQSRQQQLCARFGGERNAGGTKVVLQTQWSLFRGCQLRIGDPMWAVLPNLDPANSGAGEEVWIAAEDWQPGVQAQ
jgi:hypothetical protein